MNMGKPMSYSCSGTGWMDAAGNKQGTWIGHVLAGTALLAWAMHWNYAVNRAWLLQTRQRPYESQSSWPLSFVPQRLPVEALCKLVLPLAGIVVNIVGASGARSNVCPEHTPRAGHFDPDTMFYFANVWVLAAIVLSGMVDLLGLVVELPQGTAAAFSSVPFLFQGFIVGEAQHGNMLAANLYLLLSWVSLLTAMFTLLELVWPSSFFTSSGKVYTLYIQAIWYFAIARFLYEGRPAWDMLKPVPDMAPAMLVPVPFVFWLNVTSFAMFLVYMLVKFLLRDQIDEHAHERSGSAPKDAASRGAHEMVPLVRRP